MQLSPCRTYDCVQDVMFSVASLFVHFGEWESKRGGERVFVLFTLSDNITCRVVSLRF